MPPTSEGVVLHGSTSSLLRKRRGGTQSVTERAIQDLYTAAQPFLVGDGASTSRIHDLQTATRCLHLIHRKAVPLPLKGKAFLKSENGGAITPVGTGVLDCPYSQQKTATISFSLYHLHSRKYVVDADSRGRLSLQLYPTRDTRPTNGAKPYHVG